MTNIVIALPQQPIRAAMTALKAAVVMLVVAWILNLPGQFGMALFNEQLLVAVLGLSLALTFLSFPLGSGAVGEEAVAAKALEGREDAVGIVDVALALAALATCFYVAIRYPDLIRELVSRPLSGVIIATVIVLLVFEASRRVAGMALVIIVLVLCAHALFGWMLPEMFASRPISFSRLMVYLGVDTNALLGNTLQIAIVVVVPFIIMGQVLSRCGGSDFFSDLAASLMGTFRGGPGKIAVVGSSFFGMVSGSAVANVASVGTITIPLMKRAGYPPHTAASIEAVGSTGGQICPPVMGAAAFLMAEYLRVPYSEVMVAAIIPAFLFYAALFLQVDLEAAKLGIVGAPRATLPSPWTVLRQGGHFLLPFVVLVVGLLQFNMEPEYAALIGTGLLMVMAVVIPYKGRRLSVREVFSAATSAGGAVTDIIAITAISGILIGAMNITGVTFSLTQQLLTLSGGSLPILLILTGIVAFILGLPLPTVGVYVILAVLAAPALVQAGISPMQAHLFVLFSGILGMVTPPVALAAFAAATIARSDQWKTGWTATRMSWCAYIIPFLFAYTPALVMRDSIAMIALSLAVTLLGVLMGTIAVVGYLVRPLTAPIRLASAAAMVLLFVQPAMFPGAVWFNVVGVALATVLLVQELSFRRRGAAKSTAA